jgi:hypothetical protein
VRLGHFWCIGGVISGLVASRINDFHFPSMIHDSTEVALKHPVSTPALHLPAGTRGVVMSVYADREGCEVEFEQPVHVVLTLPLRVLVPL